MRSKESRPASMNGVQFLNSCSSGSPKLLSKKLTSTERMAVIVSEYNVSSSPVRAYPVHRGGSLRGSVWLYYRRGIRRFGNLEPNYSCIHAFTILCPISLHYGGRTLHLGEVACSDFFCLSVMAALRNLIFSGQVEPGLRRRGRRGTLQDPDRRNLPA